MWEAGITQGVSPLRLSLQGTRQHLCNFIPELIQAASQQRPRLYSTLLRLIYSSLCQSVPVVVNREFVNADNTAFPLMKQPRSVLKRQLAA